MADNTQQTPPQPQGSQQSAEARAEEERKTRELTDKVGGMIKEGAMRTGTGVKLVWHDPLIFVKLFDRAIDWARATFPRELFNIVARFMARVGHVSLLAAAPVGLAFGVTAGVRNERFSFALAGVGFVMLMLIVQYAASKLLVAGEELTLASPTVMESDAFLRCVSLISKIAGVVAIATLTVFAIDQHEWKPFIDGVGIWLLCLSLSFIALHPSLASTSVVPHSSVGEEAIGIISFFVKAFMRLVPVIFGLVAFATLILMVIVTVQQFRDRADWRDGLQLAKTLLWTALLPFAAYVCFALYCLVVELLRSILCIKEIEKKIAKQDLLCGHESGR